MFSYLSKVKDAVKKLKSVYPTEKVFKTCLLKLNFVNRSVVIVVVVVAIVVFFFFHFVRLL